MRNASGHGGCFAWRRLVSFTFLRLWASIQSFIPRMHSQNSAQGGGEWSVFMIRPTSCPEDSPTECKAEVLFVSEHHARVVYKGRGSKAPRILDLVTRWRWAVWTCLAKRKITASWRELTPSRHVIELSRFICCNMLLKVTVHDFDRS